MICYRCGKKNDADALYCIRCGAYLKDAIICHKCGTEMEKDMEHCPLCGQTNPIYDKTHSSFVNKIIKIDQTFNKIMLPFSIVVVIFALLVIIFLIFLFLNMDF